MTYTYEGDEYQIISQAGVSVEITSAFRKADYSHIEIIKVCDYKELGKVYAEKISIHAEDLKSIVSTIEMNSDTHDKEQQEILNAELEISAWEGIV